LVSLFDVCLDGQGHWGGEGEQPMLLFDLTVVPPGYGLLGGAVARLL